MATLQGKAVKNTYRQVLQIGANNLGVNATLQPVQDGGGVSTALSLSTIAATVNGDLTVTGDLIITGGGLQIKELIDDTVAALIKNGTGITWSYNDVANSLTPTITIATADGGVQGDFLQFNTGAGEANAVAKMYWDTNEGTVNLGLMGGNVVLPIGEKQVARVLNNSGSILNKSAYQVVKITAAQGQRLAVGLAQANNDANSTDTLGLVAENIANNQEGFITSSGLITNVDTTGDLQLEDWNDGDILYLSPTTPGAITKVKPVAPQHSVIVGFVVYAHKNNGKIYVKVDNGYELDELHNVKITSVANDNILQYNSSLAVWENVAGTTTNIAEGTNLYYTQGRFDSAFAAKSTTNLAEGTNLYFTTARGDANFATNFATKDTDDLPEGSTNLYYTNARTRNALSVTAGTGIAYNSTTGNFNLGSIPNASLTNSSVTVNGLSLALGASISLTTSNIAEGTNLYWTDARFDSRFGTKTTTDLDEGTNLYYTDARSRAAFSENAVGLDYSSGSGILSLTAGYAIPTTVKLAEYDTAYNRSIVSAAVTGTSTKTLSLTQQDANVVTATWTDQGITTINGTANQIAASTVGNTTTVGFTNDVTFPNNVVVSGNLTINGTATYVNTQSISSKDPLFEVANDNNTTDAVDIGYYGRYYDSAQTRVEFTGLFRDASDAGKFKFFTGLVDEPTNVVDTTGTGYTVGTLVANVEGNLAGTANAANVLSTARTITATGDAAWSVSFDGSANATAALTLANTGVTATTYGTTTAVPTIAVDSKGRITSASNTNIAFPVTTVNGASGTVVLTTTNIAEGTNQYFTTGRAQSAISLTTTGTSGAATYSGGVINVPTYIGGSGTINEIAYFSTSGVISSLSTGTYPSLTELSYVKGVTSSIQTQFSAKANDNAVVHLAGTETITGAKTFSAALNGTSATFSGTVTASSTNTNGFAFGTTSRIRQQDASTRIEFVTFDASGLYDIAAKAATFSSSVTASSFIGSLLVASGAVGGSTIYNYTSNAASRSWQLVSDAFNFGDFSIKQSTTQTGSTYADRLLISSAGNVGIGTSTPDSYPYAGKLNVNGSISSSGGKIGYGVSDAFTYFGYSVAHYGMSYSFSTNPLSLSGYYGLSFFSFGEERMRIQSGGDVLIKTALRISDSATWGLSIYKWATTGSPIFEADGGQAISFARGGVESMRIRANGNIGIGVSGNDSIRMVVRGQTSDSTTQSFNVGKQDGTDLIYVRNDGYLYSVGAWSGSDIRLKENITDLDNGLQKVLGLKAKKFDLIDGLKNNYGFIAQEMQEVIPDAVSVFEEKEQLLAVRMDYVIPHLVKAIQEQQAQIEELKALIAAK